MGLSLYLVSVLTLCVLTLFSFLRSGAIFRGGANRDEFLHPGDSTSALTSANARRRAHRRRLRENRVRILFALVVLVPPTWLTYRELAQQEAVRGTLRAAPADAVASAVVRFGTETADCRAAARATASGADAGVYAESSRGRPLGGLQRVWNVVSSHLQTRLPCENGYVDDNSSCNHFSSMSTSTTTSKTHHNHPIPWRGQARRLTAWGPRTAVCVLRTIDGLVARALLRVPVLPSASTYLVMACPAYILYIRYCFLDNRESDPAIRRRSNSWPNSLLNTLKFRVARPILNGLNILVRDFFSVELVAAYGPLPMFAFPEEANTGVLRRLARQQQRRRPAQSPGGRQASGHSRLPDDNPTSGSTRSHPTHFAHHLHRNQSSHSHSHSQDLGSSREGDGGVRSESPTVTRSASSSSVEDEWDAEEMRQLHMQQAQVRPLRPSGVPSAVRALPPLHAVAHPTDTTGTTATAAVPEAVAMMAITKSSTAEGATPLMRSDTAAFTPLLTETTSASAMESRRPMTCMRGHGAGGTAHTADVQQPALRPSDLHFANPVPLDRAEVEATATGKSSLLTVSRSTVTAAPTPAGNDESGAFRSEKAETCKNASNVCKLKDVDSSSSSNDLHSGTGKRLAALNAGSTSQTNGDENELPSETPRPVLECAQYFFAAHPHGILPVCAMVSLMSNVMGRNRKLFVDNRGFPSAMAGAQDPAKRIVGGRLSQSLASGSPSPVAELSPRASLATEGIASPWTGMHFAATETEASTSVVGAASGARNAAQNSVDNCVSWNSAPKQQQAVVGRAAGASFTWTNTRRMSGPSPVVSPVTGSLNAGNGLAFPSSGSQPSDGVAGVTPTHASASPFTFPITGKPTAPGIASEAQYITPRYAKARHFIYNPQLACFVLQGSRDEAVPPPGVPAVSEPWPPVGTFRTRLRAVVATFPFYIPVMRELYMLHGLLDASYTTCKRVLLYNNAVFRGVINRVRPTRCVREGRAKEENGERHAHDTSTSHDKHVGSPTGNDATGTAPDGEDSTLHAEVNSDDDNQESDDDSDLQHYPRDLNHLLLFPGGASEALLSSAHGPTRLLLRRRRGFLRLVMQTRSGLVPVFTFGETDYYDQYNTTSSRFAAPLEDDDSLFIPNSSSNENNVNVGESLTGEGEGSSLRSLGGERLRASSAGYTDSPSEAAVATAAAAARSGESYYARVIPSSAEDESLSACSTSTSPAVSPRQTTLDAPGGLPPRSEVEHRMLMDDLRRRREAFRARLRSSDGNSSQLDGNCNRINSSHPRNSKSNGEGDGGPSNSNAEHAARPRHSRSGKRLPRWLQVVQRLFQQVFGISLPFVRNILPKRGVKAITVVGRPIYFELPPELRRMYNDPEKYYDKEAERPLLAAAQQVYFAELKELFNRYAPTYYADHSRRKLIII